MRGENKTKKNQIRLIKKTFKFKFFTSFLEPALKKIDKIKITKITVSSDNQNKAPNRSKLLKKLKKPKLK